MDSLEDKNRSQNTNISLDAPDSDAVPADDAAPAKDPALAQGATIAGPWNFANHQRVDGPKFSFEIPDDHVAMLCHDGHPVVAVSRDDYERAQRNVEEGKPSDVDEMERIEYFESTEEFGELQLEGVVRFAIPEMLSESQRQARYSNDSALSSAVEDWQTKGENCQVMIFKTRSEISPYPIFSVCPVSLSMPDTLVIFPSSSESVSVEEYGRRAFGLANDISQTIRLNESFRLEICARIDACKQGFVSPKYFRETLHLVRNGLLAYLPQRIRNDQAKLAKQLEGELGSAGATQIIQALQESDGQPAPSASCGQPESHAPANPLAPDDLRDKTALGSFNAFEKIAARYYADIIDILEVQQGNIQPQEYVEKQADQTELQLEHPISKSEFDAMCADARSSIRAIESSLATEAGLPEQDVSKLRSRTEIPDTMLDALARLSELDHQGPVLDFPPFQKPQPPAEETPAESEEDSEPSDEAKSDSSDEDAAVKRDHEKAETDADAANTEEKSEPAAEATSATPEEVASEKLEGETAEEAKGGSETVAETSSAKPEEAEGESKPVAETASDETEAEGAGAESATSEGGSEPASAAPEETARKTEEGEEPAAEASCEEQEETSCKADAAHAEEESAPTAEPASAEPKETASEAEGGGKHVAEAASEKPKEEAREAQREAESESEPSYLAESGKFNADSACWLFSHDHVYFSDDDLVWNGKRHDIVGIQINSANVGAIPRFMDDIQSNCSSLVEFLQAIEKEDKLLSPRSDVSTAVRHALPPGDVTAISLFNLQACGGALAIRRSGKNAYEVLADRRVSEGIPGFANLVGKLVSVMRSANGIREPFSIRFASKLIPESSGYFSPSELAATATPETGAASDPESRPASGSGDGADSENASDDPLQVLKDLLGDQEIALIERDESSEPMTSRYFAQRSSELVTRVLAACQERLDAAKTQANDENRRELAAEILDIANEATLACVDVHLDVIAGKLLEGNLSNSDPEDLRQMTSTTEQVILEAESGLSSDGSRPKDDHSSEAAEKRGSDDASSAPSLSSRFEKRKERLSDLRKLIDSIEEIPRTRYADKKEEAKSKAGVSAQHAKEKLDQVQAQLDRAGTAELNAKMAKLEDKAQNLEKTLANRHWYNAIAVSIAKRRLYATNTNLLEIHNALGDTELARLRSDLAAAQAAYEAACAERDYLESRCS